MDAPIAITTEFTGVTLVEATVGSISTITGITTTMEMSILRGKLV